MYEHRWRENSWRKQISSPAEPLNSAHLRFRRLFLPIFRGCGRFERAQKPTRDPCDVVNGRIERGLVCLGWLVAAADDSRNRESE